MPRPDLDSLLGRAMERVNAGDLSQGRRLLEVLLEKDPHNDQAWVWLSACVDDPHHRRICLQQALRANPKNEMAQDGMKVLDGELVQVALPAPSLIASRLAAIGVGGDETATPQPLPANESRAAQPAVEETQPRRQPAGESPGVRLRVIVLIFLVIVLAASTMGLLTFYVILPQLNATF